ncbi:Glutaredoxin 1 [Pseudomonas phage vB_PaeM_MIJ3]|uniref:Glutaredoxin domain-containing protein n=1 Tax=Pseudomonas phage vB_PaeM_PA5oct TaxID=2163605 RepID=A0A4Y5JVE3_9CAUD|nr:thioredoxin domain [Pseudomonas phage vB_PaeM_PA5oct]WPK39175.1 thioredoxin domain [Pseudomonas phage Cassandra]WPK39687.1 thioredoxin domain [Pseudomonas phage Deifobo]WPK40723.1 thioredoxin domain [Pseudomonas phage Paride]VOH53585.1 Glutaredoxin 1 [Pseudomonas phage vB_PaeM_MIJ3]QCG76062.1 hypothetical protein EST35_0181 [Pseudomonas phage vB_PaeM_PA5oct]
MKVEIYGKENCPHCKNAVQLCEMRGLEYYYYDVSDQETGMELITELTNRIGTRPKSVPQIFIDNQHVGGYTQFHCALDAARNM